MKPRRSHLFHPLIALLISGTGLLHAQTPIYWSATGAGPHDWNSSVNWKDSGGNPTAPVAPIETRQIVFGLAPGTTVSNSFTVRLNTAGDQTLQNGMVFTGYSSTTLSRTTTFDLNSKKLVLDGGALSWWREAGSSNLANTVRFENGAFQLGATNSASLDLGQRGTGVSTANQTAPNTLIFAAGTVFDTFNTSGLWVAANSENFIHHYTLDLSAATLRSGLSENTLKVSDSIGAGAALNVNTNSSSSKNGTIKLGNLSLLDIGQDLILGQSNESRPGSSNSTATYVGDLVFSPTQGTAPLTVNIGRDLRLGVEENSTGTISGAPATLHFNVGSESARGRNIYVGYRENVKSVATDRDAVGTFVSSGGTFNAYIEQLRIGVNRNTHATSGTATGTLDFSEAELGMLDISESAEIGVGKGAVGRLLLAGGRAVSSDLTVGNASEVSTRSLLQLDDTLWTVNGDVLIGEYGDINILVGNESSGLDVAGNFTIHTDGVLTVDFSEESSDIIWALRLTGDRQSQLEEYLLNGQLIGGGAYGSLATVYQNSGFTYYGIAQIPEPSAILIGGLGLTIVGWSLRKKYLKHVS